MKGVLIQAEIEALCSRQQAGFEISRNFQKRVQLDPLRYCGIDVMAHELRSALIQT